ncbi:MAG TPA: right-handed parallel beta-helix repeat-containing protein [Rhizomicrobium sp.]
MKKTGTILSGVAAVILSLLPTSATPSNVLSFGCIQGSCSGGSLESNNTSMTPGNLVSVGGYFAAGDGGAGDFVVLGSQGTASTSVCNNYSSSIPTGTVGSVSINFGLATTTGLVVGELVSGSGSDGTGTVQVQPGSEIASITTSMSHQTQITLTLPLTGTATDAPHIALAISGNNTGTLILDVGPTGGSPNCYQKTNYRGEPHEFGAYGDGAGATPHDDTSPLQNWLGAYGNVGNLAPATAPNAFGPWHMTIPAIYLVSSELICALNTTIQGPANLSGEGAPVVSIRASNGTSGFSGGAVMLAQDYCRLSGVGIDGGVGSDGFGLADAVDVIGLHVTIDGFSALKRGNPYDLKCDVGSGSVYGLQVKDTEFDSAKLDDVRINSPCHDVRLIGDLVSGAGASGIYWGGGEGTIADGVVQESNGIGIDIVGADRLSVSAEHIEGNGRNPAAGGGAGIVIDGSTTVSVGGNHFEGNGGFGANSAQIQFADTSDNINLHGNVYEPETVSNVLLGPQFVYDATAGAVLTNSHFYDSPAPQASGFVYSPAALARLPQLQVPHVPMNAIGGLILSNGASTQKVNIAAGEASDSSNTATIMLPSTCMDNLANGGAGGLDTGSSMVAPNTTYFYFVIGTASGGKPSCIASASTTPSFVNAGTDFSTAISGSVAAPGPATYSGLPYIYNLASTAGMMPGQTVVSTNSTSYFPQTTIVSTATVTISAGASSVTSAGVTTFTSAVAGIGNYMVISDVIAAAACGSVSPLGKIPSNTYITGLSTNMSGDTVATMSAGPTMNWGNDCITISSGRTLTLAANATVSSTTAAPASATVYTGLYRLVGALYTDGSSNVVGFTQDGDTFYLNKPVNDVNATIATALPTQLALASVPNGIAVEALGRCVGISTVAGNLVHVFTSPPTAPGTPANFPTAPGFALKTIASGSAPATFPYRLYTNTSTYIAAQANGASTLQCMTDGWVLHRGQ